jgi:phosphoserine aminotransferase
LAQIHAGRRQCHQFADPKTGGVGQFEHRAVTQAKRVGNVHIACSGEPDFAAVPSLFAWSPSPRYVHYTSNETIYGTEWSAPPPAPAPLVCDASSDMFSRPLPLANHALIYAGAQKNLGPSGISLVIADKKFVETGATNLSPLDQYRVYVKERSLHNTPNTFGIWMIGEVCRWILANGGLAAMEERNRRKAKLLYDCLDGSKSWRAHAKPGSRSNMNVTFRGGSPAAEDALIAAAEARGMSGLRGHRSVGGMRASIYNAFPEEGVARLVGLLQELDA